jgi:hypothetical protein
MPPVRGPPVSRTGVLRGETTVTYLLVAIAVLVAGGALLFGAMFRRDDARLGLPALAVMIAANVLAMVHAAYDQ